MKFNDSTYTVTDSGSLGRIALVLGILGLAASAYGYTSDHGQFFHSWMVSFVFWLTVGLGALFFTLIHYLANARWSVVLRRFSEAVGLTLPLMALFFIPILFGMHDLFHWSHEEVVASDHLLSGKASYLNSGFFIIRSVGYFVIWGLVSWLLYAKSGQQEQGHSEKWLSSVRRISAPGIILFAVTITFASFDWLMSLDPHWYSTIFGVYIFSGALLGFLAFAIILNRFVYSQNILRGIITDNHYHDLGKLMFGFIIFWAYMGFSQYFLIWYANIPEETVWFLDRWVGSWKDFSLLLIFGHFAVPFVLLLTRWSKRSPIMLPLVALLLLVMHWVDLYWLVFPSYTPDGVHLSWQDAASLIGIGGIFVWFVWGRYTSRPLIPIKDPDLGTSVRHTN
ncbi:MAG: hypothetical protein P1R58_04165 [bacterium]|nr:hypothetical protein [bacterium]